MRARVADDEEVKFWEAQKGLAWMTRGFSALKARPEALFAGVPRTSRLLDRVSDQKVG